MLTDNPDSPPSVLLGMLGFTFLIPRRHNPEKSAGFFTFQLAPSRELARFIHNDLILFIYAWKNQKMGLLKLL